MPEMDPNYASPGLRWGLVLSEHPDAKHEFRHMNGVELRQFGVELPPAFGGSENHHYCVCILDIPGQDRAVGYKPVKSSGNADDWNLACTKTLGRALKRAGFPDNLADLKALMLWRRRNAEIALLSSGQPLPELISGVEQSAAELPAGQVPAEPTTDDTAPAVGDDAADDGVVDGEIVLNDSPSAAQPAPDPQQSPMERAAANAWAFLPPEMVDRVLALGAKEQGQLADKLTGWACYGRALTPGEQKKTEAYLKSLEAVNGTQPSRQAS